VSCPPWEYDGIAGARALIASRLAPLLKELLAPKFDTVERVCDTRRTHRALFKGLTPNLNPEYAGNYRGCDKPCLKYYRVGIPSDPRVGTPPGNVAEAIGRMATQVKDQVAVLDGREKSDLPGPFLLSVIEVACHLFVLFLTIHPYANGNGHIGRFIIWAVLSRYGYRIQGFPIEPKPLDPPYSPLIDAHRSGQRIGLERMILESLDITVPGVTEALATAAATP
jgi:fido (protein-threonine AMPylation protein)